MLKTDFPYRLYLVLSEVACQHYSYIEVAEKAIQGGVDLIQLREKRAAFNSFSEKALRLKEVTNRYGVSLLINDNLLVAKHMDADGIHVGLSDHSPEYIRSHWKKEVLIGYSIEALEQLEYTDAQIADYLAASPIFKTPTKTDIKIEWGLDGLQKIRELTEKPIVAIGNMHAQNAAQVIEAGADCIAVVSAICSSQNPAIAAEKIRNQIEKSL